MNTRDFSLKINDKYKLVPLLKVEKDNIEELFRGKRGVYICNYPDEEWYKKHDFIQSTNYSIEKKYRFFKLLGKGAKILSPTEDSKIKKATKSFATKEVIHFGSNYSGRIAQLFKLFKLIKWLCENRKTYDVCLCYNFYPAEIISAAFAKYILKKKVVLDFEDDYILGNSSLIYKLYFKIVKNIPNTVICINANMKSYFKNQKTYVFNGFISLSYMNNKVFDFESSFTLLYAGALDDIRGVDLIPNIVQNLKNRNKSFKIYITGSGPLEECVRNWDFEEVEFMGFLCSQKYNEIIKSVDGCLVLQKPDLPFSKGSFPSKIEYYSKHLKYIFKIELN